MSKNLSLESDGGGFRRPLTLLQRTECGGGEAGEPLSKRKFAVHPIEALGIGRVVPDDPVEVVGVQTVEVGTEGVDLDPQSQSVSLGDGPPVLPFLRGEFRIRCFSLSHSGAKRRWMRVREAVVWLTRGRVVLVTLGGTGHRP